MASEYNIRANLTDKIVKEIPKLSLNLPLDVNFQYLMIPLKVILYF